MFKYDSSGACRGAWLLVALALAGCSALVPQITPERLIQRNGESAKGPPASLKEAFQAAAELQRQYATAVMDQGNATPQLAAGLLGLSALTLFKGITGANTRDMAGAGVLGSVGWAAHSSLISKPRRDVYRAGVDALQCAMAAVTPLKPGQDQVGAPADAAANTATLYGRRAAAHAAQDALRALVTRESGLLEPALVEVRPARAAEVVISFQSPRCAAPKPDADAMAKLRYQSCVRQPPRRVETKVDKQDADTVNEQPPAALTRAFAEADAELARASARMDAANAVIYALQEAASALWTQTVTIYNTVSREVEKTTPDIASVLASVKGMKDVVPSLGGTPAADKKSQQGLPVIDAESKSRFRSPNSEDMRVERELRRGTTDLRVKVGDLDQLVKGALGAGHESARAELSRCAVKATGVTLAVSPAGSRRDVPLGTPAVFFVSGGSGVPLANVIGGPRPAGIAFAPEGGLFRFVLDTPVGAVADEEYTIRFADGGGSGVEHTVVVRWITAAAPAGAPSGTAAKGTGGTLASPSVAATRPGNNPRDIFFSMPENELALLKLDKSATDAAVRGQLKACQQRAAETHVLKTLKTDQDLRIAVLKALAADPQDCKLP